MSRFWSRSSVVVVASFVLAMGAVQAQADEGWVQPFNGKDLSGWHFHGNAKDARWAVGTARMKADEPAKLEVLPGGSDLINTQAHSLDMYTDQKFGDALIELEVMIPKGSNSGIYPMAEYEIQVIDSYGKKEMNLGDMGAPYRIVPPKVNAAKAPGEWQKFVIDFRAPRFDAQGKKIANAKFVKVVLNDQVICEDVEAPKPTGGGLTNAESATGPLMLQGNHGEVAYRNLRIKPLNAAK